MPRPIITLKKRVGTNATVEFCAACGQPTVMCTCSESSGAPATKTPTPPVKKPPNNRRAIVKPVARTGRYLCVVMGKDRPGVTKVYQSLDHARRDAARLVALNPSVSHCFVAHIVESAKLDGAR